MFFITELLAKSMQFSLVTELPLPHLASLLLPIFHLNSLRKTCMGCFLLRICLGFLCLLVCTTLSLKLDVVRNDQIGPSLRSEIYTNDRAAYLIPVGIGSPPNSMYLVLDVGSNALWFQCQPPASPSFAEVLPCRLEGCERLANTRCHKGVFTSSIWLVSPTPKGR